MVEHDFCIELIPDDVNVADIAAMERRLRTGETQRREEAAVALTFLWEPGQELRVKFLDGTPAMRKRVEEIARTWEQHANINLAFGNFAKSEIRISFDSSNGGYWSYLGTVALRFDQNDNTMSLTYGWTDAFLDQYPNEVRRTVLHEFGHALGLIHEHQSPASQIPWDREKVYAYYLETQGWDRDEVDAQVLQRRTGPAYASTSYDSSSIMQYPVPKSLTIGGFEVPWNEELSPVDKQAIGILYPR